MGSANTIHGPRPLGMRCLGSGGRCRSPSQRMSGIVGWATHLDTVYWVCFKGLAVVYLDRKRGFMESVPCFHDQALRRCWRLLLGWPHFLWAGHCSHSSADTRLDTEERKLEKQAAVYSNEHNSRRQRLLGMLSKSHNSGGHWR